MGKLLFSLSGKKNERFRDRDRGKFRWYSSLSSRDPMMWVKEGLLAVKYYVLRVCCLSRVVLVPVCASCYQNLKDTMR